MRNLLKKTILTREGNEMLEFAKDLINSVDDIFSSLSCEMQKTLHLRYVEDASLEKASFLLNLSMQEVLEQSEKGMALLLKELLRMNFDVDRMLLIKVLNQNFAKPLSRSCESLIEDIVKSTIDHLKSLAVTADCRRGSRSELNLIF